MSPLPPLPGTTDLIRRLHGGDPGALDELYDQLSRPVYSLLLRMVQEPALAEDLTQETFLRVWHRVRQFDPDRGAVTTWVLAVARNQARDYLRAAARSARQRTLSLSDAKPSVRAARLCVSRFNRTPRPALGGVWARLSAPQQRLLQLAFYEGLSYPEIAVRLGHPLGTVKSRVRAALQTLRRELRDHKGH